MEPIGVRPDEKEFSRLAEINDLEELLVHKEDILKEIRSCTTYDNRVVGLLDPELLILYTQVCKKILEKKVST